MIRKTAFTIALTIVGGLVVSPPSLAQSGSRTRVDRQGQGSGRRTRLTPVQFQRNFWEYLTMSRSAYRNWGPYPGTSEELYEGQSPHGAYLRTYANRLARENPETLPSKSIVVKENYDDQQALTAITVMYRSAGYNPSHNDWYWIKYLPDGTVARTSPEQGNRPIAGRFASCIECHSSADGNDYIFTNDK